MHDLRLSDGRALRLGKQLASRGEGTISDVIGHPEWVAKIYHANRAGNDVRGDKVRAMIAAKPSGTTLPGGSVVLTWPEYAIIGRDNKVCGFVMRKIDTSSAVEMHVLSNPADRESPRPGGPQWPKNVTWRHLLNIARNLCFAVATAHRTAAVIGDFNEGNVLVSSTTLVTLVDCDSFQFRTGTAVYPCSVGRPEYLAPELAKVPLASHVRSASSDLFVLAIHIYQLLLAGNHPFSRGDWTGQGEKPDPLTLASGGHWAGGTSSKLKTHRAAPPMSIVPPAVCALFERALGAGATNPARRPSADEWQKALSAVTAIPCSRNRTHYYSDHNTSCPWCRLAQQQKTTSAQHGAATSAVALKPAAPGAAPHPRPVAGRTTARPAPVPPPHAVVPRKSKTPRVLAAALVLFGLIVLLGSLWPETATETVSEPPGSGQFPAAAPEERTDVVPGTARACPVVYPAADLGTSAVGTTVTSCEFAEEVRAAYLRQPTRNSAVTIDAYSPVTRRSYSMDCTGRTVVTCTGGTNAVVYIY